MVRDSDSKKSVQILEAAARLMQKKSFKDLSMDELAAEAGVAKGTLYLYFRSKGDIFLSLLMEGVSELADLVRDVEKTNLSTAKEKIEAILNSSLKLMKTKNRVLRLPILAIPGATPEELEDGLRTDFFPAVDALKTKLANIFEQGINNGEFRNLSSYRLAGMFIHLLEYCYVQTLVLSDRPGTPADEIPFVKDIFFKGILT